MNSAFIPLLVFLLVIIGFLFGLILNSANGYVHKFKLSKGNINFIKYFKNNTKLIINDSNKNQISSKSQFIGNYISLVIVCIIFLEIINNEKSFQQSSFLIIYLIYLTNSFLDKVKNKTSDLNDLTKKIYSNLFLMIINFSISSYLLVDITDNKVLEVIVKIIIFFNSTYILYLTEFSFIKNNNDKLIQIVFNKMIFYYAFTSLFIYLNSFSNISVSPLKYLYYSISIILIEFMAAYIKKNIGALNGNQLFKFSVNNLAVYLYGTFLIMLSVKYVL